MAVAIRPGLLIAAGLAVVMTEGLVATAAVPMHREFGNRTRRRRLIAFLSRQRRADQRAMSDPEIHRLAFVVGKGRWFVGLARAVVVRWRGVGGLQRLAG